MHHYYYVLLIKLLYKALLSINVDPLSRLLRFGNHLVYKNGNRGDVHKFKKILSTLSSTFFFLFFLLALAVASERGGGVFTCCVVVLEGAALVVTRVLPLSRVLLAAGLGVQLLLRPMAMLGVRLDLIVKVFIFVLVLVGVFAVFPLRFLPVPDLSPVSGCPSRIVGRQVLVKEAKCKIFLSLIIFLKNCCKEDELLRRVLNSSTYYLALEPLAKMIFFVTWTREIVLGKGNYYKYQINCLESQMKSITSFPNPTKDLYYYTTCSNR